MFYAAMAFPTATGTMTIGRATANVSSPFTWTEYVSNPILSGPSGHSIRLDSMQYVSGTWYAYVTDFVANTILLYTSSDGFTFAAYGSNPVLSPTGQGCTDGTVVSQGAVLKDGSTWHMYYSYRTASTTLTGIRYATSSDGQTWTKQGCTDILSLGPPGASDSLYMEWHQILKIGSDYLLTYEGYNNSSWTANLAHSTSPGSGWAKSSSNPVFGPSFVGSTWDQNHVATAAYYQIGGTWYLFYQGAASAIGGTAYTTGHWSLGMATLGSDPTAAFP